MPKTKEVVACVDHKNHRTEYQLLTNILIDNNKTLGDVIKEHDLNKESIDKIVNALNNNADNLENLVNVIKLLLELLEGVLNEDDLNSIQNILLKKGTN